MDWEEYFWFSSVAPSKISSQIIPLFHGKSSLRSSYKTWRFIWKSSLRWTRTERKNKSPLRTPRGTYLTTCLDRTECLGNGYSFSITQKTEFFPIIYWDVLAYDDHSVSSGLHLCHHLSEKRCLHGISVRIDS